jgi:peptidoglycan/LPS O-acetylase OafA/YrhL
VQRSDRSSSHFVGFDGFRLLAAFSVIFSHAFLLATGHESNEPLVRLLGPGNILGLYGVFTFFIISGFLLGRSLAANQKPLTYAVNRTLRILPGFMACVAVTAFVIGPLFSARPLRDYFSLDVVGNYLRWSLTSLADTQMPGLFAYDGASAGIVNGSLWSLRYEALSYVFLLALWLSLGRHSRVAAAALALSVAVWTFPAVAGRLLSIGYTLPYFSAGVVMSWFYGKYGTHVVGAAISLAGLVVAAMYGWQLYAFAFFGAYLVVFLGERPNIGSAIAARLGDCSYGLYLYGWPAEQIAKQVTGTDSVLVLLLIATPLAFACAVASYRAVERPAMNARVAVTGFISRTINAVLGERQRAAAWGAKLAFIVSATFVLTAEVRWWYFFESLGLMALSALAGAIVASIWARLSVPTTSANPAAHEAASPPLESAAK